MESPTELNWNDNCLLGGTGVVVDLNGPSKVTVCGEDGLDLLSAMVREAWRNGKSLSILCDGKEAVVFEPDKRDGASDAVT